MSGVLYMQNLRCLWVSCKWDHLLDMPDLKLLALAISRGLSLL